MSTGSARRNRTPRRAESGLRPGRLTRYVPRPGLAARGCLRHHLAFIAPRHHVVDSGRDEPLWLRSPLLSPDPTTSALRITPYARLSVSSVATADGSRSLIELLSRTEASRRNKPDCSCLRPRPGDRRTRGERERHHQTQPGASRSTDELPVASGRRADSRGERVRARRRRVWPVSRRSGLVPEGDSRRAATSSPEPVGRCFSTAW